jgi:EmrB/QacA subfamily drug resistance transporter
MTTPTDTAPVGAQALAGGEDVVGATVASSGNWVVPLVVLIVGMFLSVLDVSIINVAVPSIQHSFGSGVGDTQWVITAYSLTLGVVVPVSGWLGDRFGLGRTYNVSLVGFAVCSGLCGLAWNLPSLVIFRILQAVPGGILPVITLTMVYRLVPKDRLGIAMAMYGIGVMFAPAIGPTLGGYLVEYQSWHWIFLINVPIGLVGAAWGFDLLRGCLPGVPVGQFDRLGFLTLGGGLFALLLALSKGQDWGWGSYRVLMLLCYSVLSLALFVVVELATEHPLLDVRIFALWQFTNSLLLIVVLSLGLFSMLFYLPLFVQEGLGATPFYTGLMMLPEAVAMVCILPVAGLLYDRFGPRLPSVIGLAIAAYGTYLLCGISAAMTARDVVIWTWVRGIGNGLAMIPIMTAGLAVVPGDRLNQASAINNVVQRVTGALGLAVISAVVGHRQAQILLDNSSLLSAANPVNPALRAMLREGVVGLYPLYQRAQTNALASAYSDAFLVIAIATAVGGLLALLLRTRVSATPFTMAALAADEGPLPAPALPAPAL